jgi:hypothetical protein
MLAVIAVILALWLLNGIRLSVGRTNDNLCELYKLINLHLPVMAHEQRELWFKYMQPIENKGNRAGNL